MFYVIYKTTNIVNGKFYIGKHKTKCLDDGYMGSGKILKHAISKYGLDNFHREILHVCESEKRMNVLEKILVVPDVEINYNLCDGGKGGWSYLNRSGLNVSDAQKEAARKTIKNIHSIGGSASQAILKEKQLGIYDRTKNGFKGKSHTEEWKISHSDRMKIIQRGNKNSQYGTYWITNGQENKKIKKDIDNIPEGWYKGRVIKKTG